MPNGANYLNRKITKKYDVPLAPTYYEWARSEEGKEWLEDNTGKISSQAKKSMNDIINRRLEAEKGVKEPDYEDESTQKLLYGDEDVGAEATKFIDGSNGLAGAVDAGAAVVNAAANNMAGGGTVVPLPVFKSGEASGPATMSDQYTSSEDNAYKQYLAIHNGTLNLPYNLTGSTGLLGDEAANTLNPQAYAMQNAQIETPEDMRNQREVLNSLKDAPRQFAYGFERDIAQSLLRAAENTADGISGWLYNAGADFMGALRYYDAEDWLRDKAKTVYETPLIKDPDEYLSEINERYKPTELQQKVGDVTSQIAPILLASGLGTAGGAAGLSSQAVSDATFFANAAGGSAREAYKQTGDAQKAANYGLYSGLAELGTEKLFSVAPGMFDSNSVTKEAIDRVAQKLASKPAIASALRTITDVTGEGVEEVISEYLDPVALRLSGVNPEASTPEFEQVLESFLGGAITSAALQMGSGVALAGTKYNPKESLVKPAEQKMLSPQESPIKSVVPLDDNGNIQTVQQDIQTQQEPFVVRTDTHHNGQEVVELPIFDSAKENTAAITVKAKASDINSTVTDILNEYSVPASNRSTELRAEIGTVLSEAYTNGKLDADKLSTLHKRLVALSSTKANISDAEAGLLADIRKATIKRPAGLDKQSAESINGIKLRNKEGVDIGSLYAELSEKYPGLIGEAINPIEQLIELSDIRKKLIDTGKAYNPIMSGEIDETSAFSKAMDAAAVFATNGTKAAETARVNQIKTSELKKLPIRNEDGSVNTANLLELRRNEWRFDTDLKRFNERSGITAAEKKVADLVASGDMDIRNIPKDMSAARIMEYATLKADADALHAHIREYNAEYQAGLEARADAILEGMENWQDVRIPASNAISTPERVIRHTVKDPVEQEKVVDALIRTGGDADARAVQIYNDVAQQVTPYKFTPDESKYIQMLGEGVITEAELPSNVSASRVKEGVQVFRGIYENLYQMVNEELVRTGQKPMGRIENYFPHINDPKDPLRRALKSMGFDVTSNALPTEINGRTEDFKPKHQWSRFMQRRTGNKTDYDALYGLDQYARSMANVVAYTDHIQLLRTVGNKVRFAHSDEGTQAKVREIMADQNLTVDEKQAAIDKFKANGDTHLSNFAAWIDEYANIIAGKKTRPDRVIESAIGRRAYSAANWLSTQLSRSVIAGNISSAMTNGISVAQAAAFTSKPAMLKANIDMAKNLKHNDGFVERSKFLQRRFGENKIYKTGIEKAIDKVDIMGLTDRYTAELIVRSKYNEGISQGMDAKAAIEYADGFAANLMGDRSRTQAPTAFGSKNPGSKAVLQFQLEQLNQLAFLKTDAKRYAGGSGKLAGKLLEYALLMYLFDDAYEAIFGRRPALDPLGMANNIVGDATGKKLNNVFYMLGGEPIVRDVEQKGATETVQNAAMDVAEQIPVLGSALGGGRVPVLNTIGKVLDFELLGEIGQTLEGNIAPSKLLDDAGTWALETGAFFAPFGGGQAKKTIQGFQTVGAGGNYKRQNDGSEELQYEVDQTPWNWIKGAVGGKTAVGGGRYYEDGYPKAEPSTNEGIIEQHVRALPNIVTYKTGEGEDAEKRTVTLSDDMRALRQQFTRNLIPDGVDLIELDEDVRKDMFKAIDDFTLDAVLERTGHPEYTTSKDTNTAIEALKADVSLPVFYGIKQAFSEENEDGSGLTRQQKRNILMDWPDLSTEQKTRLDEIMLDVGTDVDYSSARTFELTNSGLNDKQQKAYSQLRSQGIDMSEYEDILDTISTIKSSGDGSGSGNGGSAAVARYINNLPYDSTAKQIIADAAGINRDYSTQDAFVVSAMNESPQLKYKEAKKYVPNMTGDAWAKAWQAMTDAGSSKTKQKAALKRLGYTSQQASDIVDVRWMKLADLKD